MELKEFFVWLSGLGATLVFSYIAERWAWFQAQTIDAKKLYSVLGASVIAVLAFVTYTYVPADVWIALAPYWKILVGVFGTIYGMQVFHKYDKTLVK